MDRGRAAYAAVEDRVPGWLRLCRILPQHAASGAAVYLVLRLAGNSAALVGALAEANSQRAVLYSRDRCRAVHVRARRRANARRGQFPAARTETRCHRARIDDGASLSLLALSDVVSLHH